MALDAVHPQYSARVEDWELMRHSYAGEAVVKSKGTKYLPATPSQIVDGITKTTSLGYKNYQSYLMKAVFHDHVSDAVESYIGLLHQKPAVFELPAKMQPLLENASINGEGLQNLLRRINEQQLVMGRIGLLLDLPVTPDPTNPLPYIATYMAEAIRNWDDSSDQEGRNFLNFACLDETSDERQSDFGWLSVEKYRVLLLEPAEPFVADEDKSDEENNAIFQATPKVYKTGVFRRRDTNDFNASDMRIPMLRGTPLEEVPFVIVNSKDVIAQPDDPPLVGLARLSMAIYRGEAGYRETLFMQSQDTLVTTGGRIRDIKDDDRVRIGAGAHIELDVGADAKFIGVSSAGLAEQRLSLENDKKRAETKSGQLIAPSGQVESDATLTTRMAAQTATLNQIAWSGAKGLEYILKVAARWMGLNPDEVKVTPNLDFSNFMFEGKSFDDIMNAKGKGFPISLKSLHEVAVDRGLSQMTYEEEMKLITQERVQQAAELAAVGLDPTGKPIPPAPVPSPASK